MKSPIKLTYPLPKPGDPGYFATVRRHDIHTGIDLYCEDGAEVSAMEDGVVVAIEKFTGAHAGSPWWNDTWAILIEGKFGVIVYGEISIHHNLAVGDSVKEGDVLGNVAQVLKKDKGVTPTSMLHLELMEHGVYATYWWESGTDIPAGLKNPIVLFEHIEDQP